MSEEGKIVHYCHRCGTETSDGLFDVKVEYKKRASRHGVDGGSIGTDLCRSCLELLKALLAVDGETLSLPRWGYLRHARPIGSDIRYRDLSEEDERLLNEVTAAAHRLSMEMILKCGAGLELRTATERLEESLYWATMAIVRKDRSPIYRSAS